jgi:carboxypeptidase PM20D1
VLLVRAVLVTAPQVAPPPAESIALDSAGALARLAGAIRIPTVSEQDSSRLDRSRLDSLAGYIAGSFPLVHATLERERVNGHSLLYTWRGTDPERPGVLFAAHLDVVPVERGTEGEWTQPPFSGAMADGYIWGRGALDDKASAFALLEAVQALVASGFDPTATVYLAFGHDEELGGAGGTRRIAALLAERGVRLAGVLDEGGAVLSDLVPGVAAPVATVGVAEKGEVSLELVASAPGGHSSMPPERTPIATLGRALDRLASHPFPARIDGGTRGLLQAATPEMHWPLRVVFANLWLFGPVVERRLLAEPATAATVRTTVAATMVEGGTKENVLPARARAVVNLRILPGDSVRSVVDRVRRVIADSAVQVQPLGEGTEPSSVSPTDSPMFVAIATALRQVRPDAVVAPYLVVGQTDARYYTKLTPNVYRFTPFALGRDDLDRLHGTDERIGMQDYIRGVRFYVQLLRELAR